MTTDISQMHNNSLTAYAGLDIDERSRLVLAAYVTHWSPLTDRDCMRILGFTEMNQVRPRITALIERGVLEECGNVKCPETKKTVRLCRPVKGKA
jgi:predicted HTH transcriptional regulator